jgi:hypothetical protein
MFDGNVLKDTEYINDLNLKSGSEIYLSRATAPSTSTKSLAEHFNACLAGRGSEKRITVERMTELLYLESKSSGSSSDDHKSKF